MTWLAAIILPILKPFGAWLIGVFTKDLFVYVQKVITNYFENRRANQIAKDNAANSEQKTKEGTLDEKAKAGESLLNGEPP